MKSHMVSFKEARNYLIGMTIILSLGFLMFVQPALAYTYCINGSWLGDSTDIEVNGVNTHIFTPEYCQYGCDSKLMQCNPSEWESMTGPVGSWGLFPMIAIFIAVVIGLMYFASRHH